MATSLIEKIAVVSMACEMRRGLISLFNNYISTLLISSIGVTLFDI
jgi:hypothetical protein